jgi:hypothetical protein
MTLGRLVSVHLADKDGGIPGEFDLVPLLFGEEPKYIRIYIHRSQNNNNPDSINVYAAEIEHKADNRTLPLRTG